MTIITILAPAMEEPVAQPSLSRRSTLIYIGGGEIERRDRLELLAASNRERIKTDRKTILESSTRVRLGTLEH